MLISSKSKFIKVQSYQQKVNKVYILLFYRSPILTMYVSILLLDLNHRKRQLFFVSLANTINRIYTLSYFLEILKKLILIIRVLIIVNWNKSGFKINDDLVGMFT